MMNLVSTCKIPSMLVCIFLMGSQRPISKSRLIHPNSLLPWCSLNSLDVVKTTPPRLLWTKTFNLYLDFQQLPRFLLLLPLKIQQRNAQQEIGKLGNLSNPQLLVPKVYHLNGCKVFLALLGVRLHCLFTWFPASRAHLIWVVLYILHGL